MMPRAFVLGGLAALAVAGCGNSPSTTSTSPPPIGDGVDSDGDGVGAGASTIRCSGGSSTPPKGYSVRGDDCAPDDGARWQTLAYSLVDGDGDHYFVPQNGSLCAGATLPAGYAASGIGVGSDCDDTNPNVWTEAPFYRDADGDGYTVATSTSVCAGATPPAGYAATMVGPDCDDTNAAIFKQWSVFVDGDGDGFGTGALTTVCQGAAFPSGYSALDTDCNDANAGVWASLAYNFRDADGDSYTVAGSGTLCTNGSLPAGYLASAKGSDCNDTDPTVWQSYNAWSDSDGDGVGDGSEQTLCAGAALPSGYATKGGDCAPSDGTR
ncbi:MAG TPA: MopE-related protein, partial [Polyangia bacterium]|nr:MopE-related protein [Polyangia bacterium]